jgi:serine/threonine protein phosphatase PrpC
MEDYIAIKHKVGNDINSSAFCVFDGHNGSQVPNICAYEMPLVLDKLLKENDKEYNCESEISDILPKAFPLVNKCLSKSSHKVSGSTAVVCITRKENDKKWLYSGNAGDARAVLIP